MTLTARYVFPKGFLWGTATAAHQVEGDNTANQWWAWEQSGRVFQGQTSAAGCEWWRGRWKEDFARAAEAGHNAIRFSLEWSRIQPEPNRWDEDALERYRTWARTARQMGLEPLVTLHHFTDPLWLAERGGWESAEAVAHFRDYAARVVTALQEYVRLWATFNEPNIYAYRGYVEGAFPPGRTHDLAAAFTVMEHMAQAHAAAYQAIHRVQPNAQVGIVVHYRGMRPARPWFPLDRWITRLHHRWLNDFYYDALVHGRIIYPGRRARPVAGLRGTLDYLGLNYYTEDRVRFVPRAAEVFGVHRLPPDAPLSAHGEIAHVPTGLYRALRWAHGFGVPIYITENGLDDADDRLRPRYLLEHVHQVWRALINNWPVRGYLHWSLIDNFEWEWGWSRHFGLWACDPQTQRRRPRPSAHLFAAMAQANGIEAALVDKYAPAARAALFPDAGLRAWRAP